MTGYQGNDLLQRRDKLQNKLREAVKGGYARKESPITEENTGYTGNTLLERRDKRRLGGGGGPQEPQKSKFKKNPKFHFEKYSKTNGTM